MSVPGKLAFVGIVLLARWRWCAVPSPDPTGHARAPHACFVESVVL